MSKKVAMYGLFLLYEGGGPAKKVSMTFRKCLVP